MKRYTKILLASVFVLCLTFTGGLVLGGSGDMIQWGPEAAVAVDCENDSCSSLGFCKDSDGSGIRCDALASGGCEDCTCGSDTCVKPEFQ